jgi:hypothetical protein
MPDDWKTQERLNLNDLSGRFRIKLCKVKDKLEHYLNELPFDEPYLFP